MRRTIPQAAGGVHLSVHRQRGIFTAGTVKAQRRAREAGTELMRGQGIMVRDASSDVAAVRALSESLRQAVNASDVDGILACWSEDGLMLPPHHPVVEGRGAIGEYFARVFAARRLAFTFTGSDVALHGDVAIERLQYTAIAVAESGEESQDAGKGIHVCTRRPDGGWQLTHDIWNSDRAHAAAGR